MEKKKTLVWLVCLLLGKTVWAYQENFSVSDSLDFSVNVFGGFVLDTLSNSLGFIPVILAIILFLIILRLLFRMFQGSGWLIK